MSNTSVKILCVSGARPNFVKIAPIMRALGQERRFVSTLVHTGQHYDDSLSKVFFDELEIPRPDINLDVGSGCHGRQTAEIMSRFEQIVQQEQPHAVLVVGDVNSTVACSLIAAKTQLAEPFDYRGQKRSRPVTIHIEAGLRSFDEDMPEETNRRVTDCLSDMLFVSERSGVANLRREGVADDRVFFVGNVMIDSLLAVKRRAMASDVLQRLNLHAQKYALITLHRPRNVDDPDKLRELLQALDHIAQDYPIVFPVHPRTRPKLEATGVFLDAARWHIVEPQGYLDFVKLMASTRLMLTDSGGVQEETTVLQVPCLTLRDNTERPVTIDQGTNKLAGTRKKAIIAAYQTIDWNLSDRVPELWDGQTAQRILAVLQRSFF